MNQTNTLILILVILSQALTGYALAADKDVNISTNETIADQVSTVDTIAINDNVNIINITKNSNETIVAETILKEEQTKSSPGFSLADTAISLITAAILIMAMICARKKSV